VQLFAVMDPNATRSTCDGTFERRLRAGVRAGAWLLLLPVALLLFQWFLYLAVMSARPAWFLALLGPDVEWHDVQMVWLGGMVLFKLVFWTQAILVLWGALWASMLRADAARLHSGRPAEPSSGKDAGTSAAVASSPVR
jgi:hypothetical protein